MLYDDFTELRPGALSELEHNLKFNGGFYQRNPTSAYSESYSSNTGHRRPQGGVFGLNWWLWKPARVLSPSLPLHKHQDAVQRTSYKPPTSDDLGGLCVFLCLPHRRSANKLHAWAVEKTHTDQQFFFSLRSFFKRVRGRKISKLSLKTVKSIRFVSFEVYSKLLVDIRTTPHIPEESRKEEYSYHPMPADFIPPIGENHLMHLYTYPEEAEQTGICLRKIPKKIEGLAWLSTHPQGSKVGWGLQLVEGLDWTNLWILGIMGFLASIMFGIAWALVRNDIQGGFGVAACMLVGLSFTTGMVQAAHEPQ